MALHDRSNKIINPYAKGHYTLSYEKSTPYLLTADENLRMQRYITEGPRNRAERRDFEKLLKKQIREDKKSNKQQKIDFNEISRNPEPPSHKMVSSEDEFNRVAQIRQKLEYERLKNAGFTEEARALRKLILEENRRAREAKEAIDESMHPNKDFYGTDYELLKARKNRQDSISAEIQYAVAEEERINDLYAKAEDKYQKWEDSLEAKQEKEIERYLDKLEREQERRAARDEAWYASQADKKLENDFKEALKEHTWELNNPNWEEEAEEASIKSLEKMQRYLEREERDGMKLMEEARANELNEMLQYASSIYGGNKEYGRELKALLKELMNDPNYKPQPGDGYYLENPYFEISKDYTGKTAELFKYVTFKRVPEEYEASVIAIGEMDWSSPENYYSHLADIAAQKYDTLLKGSGYDPFTMDILESIMNSSAAWHIACRDAYDSDQALENWQELYDAGRWAIQEGDEYVVDEYVAMILNEDRLDYILRKVDELVDKIVFEED